MQFFIINCKISAKNTPQKRLFLDVKFALRLFSLYFCNVKEKVRPVGAQDRLSQL